MIERSTVSYGSREIPYRIERSAKRTFEQACMLKSSNIGRD